MKVLYKALGAALVAGALLLAGCAAEKKSLPKLEDQSSDVIAKAFIGYSMALNAVATFVDGTDPGVEGVTATFGTNTCTIDLDSYDDGDGDFITGQVVVTLVSSSVVTISGSIVVSGAVNTTVSFSLTVTSDKETGTFTVDGVKYSYSYSASSSSVFGKTHLFKKKAE